MRNPQRLVTILLAIIIFENFPNQCRAWTLLYRRDTFPPSTTTITAATETETPTSISSLGPSHQATVALTWSLPFWLLSVSS
ncbi:expressed protein [Echinococcus multilocularis]|uniref:Expressed protein n=1 Tax=Echinococcus multilocularis TaxID=6211 RepID=A0A068XWV0_ECHMU|nr:expressed protein [Echinococcus multilocularis]